jgi:hypothetical protein
MKCKNKRGIHPIQTSPDFFNVFISSYEVIILFLIQVNLFFFYLIIHKGFLWFLYEFEI